MYSNRLRPCAKSSKSGFTLIELLVVIAIIAILAAILFPVFASAREKARESSCASNLKQLSLGLIQYTQDFDEHFPAMGFNGNTWYDGGGASVGNETWELAVSPYINSLQVLTCPDDAQAGYEPAANSYRGYEDSYSINGDVSCYTAAEGYAGCYCHGISCKSWYPFYKAKATAGANVASITYPVATILLCESWAADANSVDTNGHATAFGQWNAIGSNTGTGYNCQTPTDIPSGADTTPLNPLQPEGNTSGFGANGAVSTHHTQGTRSNFSFVDGHVKSMQPIQTNLTGTCGTTNANNMWDAIRQ